ncbi:MAG: ABC transporter ATP-binding protein [Anaerohalosphaeraceae bacterium]|nr:ABC transporter ATP-binding protein [Anaerohalosphaeraceae bacterium]
MNKNNCIMNCSGICKTYQMGAARLEVLKGLDLSVASGEFLAIVGSSGSGKSTLLHIMGALDKPDKGSVSFNGTDLSRLGRGRLNAFRNKNIGFVFQFYHLLDELTLLENVLLPRMVSVGTLGWAKVRKGARKAAKELLERLSLADRAAHKPYQLSGGQRQRAAIARALINGPDILLADEPTGNLDSETGNGILKVFNELHRAGQTIVMVTHDEKIAAIADRTIELVDGRVSAE